jgi:hypothetical protein
MSSGRGRSQSRFVRIFSRLESETHERYSGPTQGLAEVQISLTIFLAISTLL